MIIEKPPLGALAHADFNLEEEYGYFLERLQTHLEEDLVEHFGVKGMKWGVRQKDPAKEIKGIGPSKVVVKTKSGETLTLSKDRPPAIARFMARHNPSYLEKANRFASVTIRDSSGKKVGDAELHKENKDEINLVWLGIKNSERGKGYASATMKAAVDFGKHAGVKKLTLEVPGNAPDAKHIYEKLGFKSKGKIDDPDSDDVWGGLEKMELNFDEARHMTTDELVHIGVKGMKWGHRKAPTIGRTGERRYATNAKSANRRKTAMKVGGAALALGGAAAAAYLLKGSVGSTTVSAATSAVARSRPLEHDFAHLLSTPLSQANVQSLYDIARSG